MFFSVTQNTPDSRFFNNHKHQNLFFNCDSGWHCQQHQDHTVYYKGYVVANSLEETAKELVKDSTPRHQGNFCCVIFDSQGCVITHDQNRGFPLYQNSQQVTNLQPSAESITVYADRYITVNNKFESTTVDFDNGQRDCVENYSYTQALSQVIKQVGQHINDHRTAEIPKLFVSGGVDTVLISAFVKSMAVPAERIHYEHFDHDDFVYRNKSAIKTAWAYNQMHHWSQSSVLFSGACGDEYFMRGPLVGALWATWHNINVIEELKPTHYHYRYFLQDKNKKIFVDHWQNRHQIQDQYPDYTALAQQILNINANDHQHWHLGNTLTVTPFKNLNLTKIILGMPQQQILDQLLDARFNKDLIQHLDSDSLLLLSDQKNYNSTEKLRHE